MTDPNKAKGDKAEREAADLLTRLLNRPVRRLLGAGRADDHGDLDGVKDWALQVAWWPSNVLRAIRAKPLDAQAQAERSGDRHSAALIRLVGGQWRVVMTPEQWARVVHDMEATRAALNYHRVIEADLAEDVARLTDGDPHPYPLA